MTTLKDCVMLFLQCTVAFWGTYINVSSDLKFDLAATASIIVGLCKVNLWLERDK